MKAIATAVFSLLLGTSALQAQAHGVSRRPFTQEQFAEACEKGDPAKLLNVSCDQIRGWLNIYRQGLNIGPGQLASYIRQLTVIDCPTGQEYPLNRTKNGRILYENKWSGWKRAFSAGERCLYDNNRGEIQFSLSCANSPYEILPVGTAMVPTRRETPPQVAAGPRTDTLVLKVVQNGPFVVENRFQAERPKVIEMEPDYEVRKKGFWCFRGAWQGLTCTAIIGGIGYGTYSALQKKEAHAPGLPTVIALPPGPGAYRQ